MQTDVSRDRPATGRFALVYRFLADALATLTPGGGPLRLLDCGGGSGTFAVPLAVAGADVTVVDISADALATLHRRAGEAGVSSLVHPVQGDVEAPLLDALGSGDPHGGGVSGYDAVLAHGILEAVDDVERVFADIAATVRPGGLLSVLVTNPAAAVLARALSGELDLALRGLQRLAGASDAGSDHGSDRPAGPDAAARMCAAAGLVVEARRGIGAFSDLVPGAALDSPGAREALARLDLEAAGRSPFAELAGRVHLLARRPAG